MISPLPIMLAFVAFLCFGTLNIFTLASPISALSESTKVNTTSDVDNRAAAAPYPKRGLPFNDARYIQHWAGGTSQVNWAYNWDSGMPGNFAWGLEFIPMLWSDRADHTGVWFNNANNAISRGSGHILSFNEPDNCNGQARMSPQHAVDAYRKYIMPFSGRAALGAPAVTNGAGGLPWLREFLRLCTGCQIDFVPIHWYDSATNVGYFTKYVEDAHNAAGGRQIWLTEFNGRGSVDQQATFLRAVMPWLDAQPYVMRYAWFWCDPYFTGGSLVRGDGYPSDLGSVYAYTPY